MNPWHSIPGTTLREQAVAIAGALAELGVAALSVRAADGVITTLAARRTDLPSVLERCVAAGGIVVAEALGIEIGEDSTMPAAARLAWRSNGEEGSLGPSLLAARLTSSNH